jgi:ABC-2 type transport system ATP-binding protein
MDGTSTASSTMVRDFARREMRAHHDGHTHTLVEVTGLSKRYRGEVAVADISFTVAPGEILGIIGPNGAGKTTLLEAFAGILLADAGIVCWDGAPVPASRRHERIFYVPDGGRPYQDQFVIHVVSFFASVYGRSDAFLADVIALAGLRSVLAKRVQALSKGYGRRLVLALGLLTPHALVLMDEPFDGFDLRQTRDIIDVLRGEAAKGRALLLAIHQLADAERVCDRFILLSAGCVRGCGTLEELRTQTGLPKANLEEIFLALT